jgi:hypothetical protein
MIYVLRLLLQIYLDLFIFISVIVQAEIDTNVLKVNLQIKPIWYTIFLVCLFLFCTCFGQLCAPSSGKLTINTRPGIFHSVWMTVWYAGSCIPDDRTHRVTNTKRRIDKLNSPNDGHIVARNMYRI